MTTAATVRQPKVAKVAKKRYCPRIVRESANTFTVPSERYTHILWTVTVADDGRTSCDCTAGSFGRTCKHSKLIAAYVAYCAHPSHLREQVEESTPVLAAPIELASRRKPAFVPAPAEFAEMFS